MLWWFCTDFWLWHALLSLKDNIALIAVLEAKFGNQGTENPGKRQLLCVVCQSPFLFRCVYSSSVTCEIWHYVMWHVILVWKILHLVPQLLPRFNLYRQLQYCLVCSILQSTLMTFKLGLEASFISSICNTYFWNHPPLHIILSSSASPLIPLPPRPSSLCPLHTWGSSVAVWWHGTASPLSLNRRCDGECK